MRFIEMISPALKITAIATALLCASQIATAQTPERVISCIQSGDMLEHFLDEDTDDLPNYSEAEGARVQRQHPTTHMYLHAKYIERESGSATICQYFNNFGMVAAYVMLNTYADASDGECSPRYCVQGAYWRKEWTESHEADDKPGAEYIYTCMRDRPDGRAFPSGACGFSVVAE